jgi:hypothetical protein
VTKSIRIRHDARAIRHIRLGTMEAPYSTQELHMPSHAYFFDSDDVPDWDADESPVETEKLRARRELIASAIEGEFPEIERVNRSSEHHGWIELWLPGSEIVVYHDFLHLRLRWRSRAEMQELQLVEHLHRLARVVDEAVGFDFFEHGCQGLGCRASIDRVPDFIAPTARRIGALFGTETPS